MLIELTTPTLKTGQIRKENCPMIELTLTQKEINRILKNYKKHEDYGLTRLDLRMYLFNIELIDKDQTPELYEAISDYNKKLNEEIEYGDDARDTLVEDIANSLKKRKGKEPTQKAIKAEIRKLKEEVYAYYIKKGRKKFNKIMKKFF